VTTPNRNHETFALLGYYTASIGNILQNYQYSLRNNPEPSSQLLCGGSLKSHRNNFRIFRPITRALSIQKRSKIVKNEHARYTLERFPTDFRALSIQKRSKVVKNKRVRYTLGARYRLENTVI
jgi:hypothetical protein